MRRLIAILLVVGACSVLAYAEGDKSTPPAAPETPAPPDKPQPATPEKPPTPAPPDKPEPPKSEADQVYDRVVQAYLHGKWPELIAELDRVTRLVSALTKTQREDVAYIRKMVVECRPAWWKNARSGTPVSFKAGIWNRNIDANYMPTEQLGFQAPVDIYRGRVRVIVSWKPSMVDSPRAAEGRLAKLHALSKGDIADMIVWHELGHNYITSALPAKQVVELYMDYQMVYSHLQEFFADLTSLRHCAPPGRLVSMMLRLDALDENREEEPHTRAAHGIGALILAHVLAEPNKWPSMRLPGAVPDEDVERNTLIYLYEHIAPTWTLAEDRALQKMIGDYVTDKGNDIFRKRGQVPLPNKLDFYLMTTDDREMQPKRNAWVKARLEEHIKAGRCDAPVEKKKHKVVIRTPRGTRVEYHFDDDEELRIEIPW